MGGGVTDASCDIFDDWELGCAVWFGFLVRNSALDALIGRDAKVSNESALRRCNARPPKKEYGKKKGGMGWKLGTAVVKLRTVGTKK